MSTIPQLIALGWHCQQMGDLAAAERAYRQAVAIDGQDAEARFRLGVISVRLGQLEEAIGCLSQAARLAPQRADVHSNLGVAHACSGHLPEAAASFEEALRLNPEFLDARQNLGSALRDQGRLLEAVRCFREVLARQPAHVPARLALGSVLLTLRELDEATLQYRQAVQLAPHDAEAHNGLGLVFVEQGRLDEAIACFEQACQLRPDLAEAYTNLGSAYGRQGKAQEAAAYLRRAVLLRPDAPEVHNSLGAALAKLDQFDLALEEIQQALRLRPNFVEALSNQGDALRRSGRLDEAVASLRTALELYPNSADARHNLSITLADLGQLDEALREITEALRQRPDEPEWRKNRGIMLLRRGDWEDGWREFEARWGCKDLPKRPFTQPQWHGEPLDGKVILLHAEQGLGDTIQFIRYAALVKARGATVLVECPSSLHRILADCAGIDRLIAAGAALPAFDFHSPLMSLPGIFGTTVATVPNTMPYLAAEPQRVARWAEKLRSVKGLKIGLSWQGNRQQGSDRFRSIPLRYFIPLASVPGVSLIALQTGPGKEQLAELRGQKEVIDLDDPSEETYRPFEESAALMKNLDLIVASDSSLVHLAGALGVPIWVALHTSPDWRWLEQRSDSPWYPTMRLFRQRTLGQWGEVFQNMAEELRQRLDQWSPLFPLESLE